MNIKKRNKSWSFIPRRIALAVSSLPSVIVASSFEAEMQTYYLPVLCAVLLLFKERVGQMSTRNRTQRLQIRVIHCMDLLWPGLLLRLAFLSLKMALIGVFAGRQGQRPSVHHAQSPWKSASTGPTALLHFVQDSRHLRHFSKKYFFLPLHLFWKLGR